MNRHSLGSHLKNSRSCLILSLTLGLSMPGSARGDAAQQYARSYQLEAAGKASAAVKALARCPSAQQNTYFYQARLGWLRYLAADHPGAIKAYQRAAKLGPRAIEPLLGVMLPQMAMRRWKDAADMARAALRKDAKNFLANSRLAWALYNLGRFAESERVYRRVLELYPANLEMRSGLGWAQLKQGKKAEAQKTFRGVLAVSPKNSAALDGLAAVSTP